MIIVVEDKTLVRSARYTVYLEGPHADAIELAEGPTEQIARQRAEEFLAGVWSNVQRECVGGKES